MLTPPPSTTESRKGYGRDFFFGARFFYEWKIFILRGRYFFLSGRCFLVQDFFLVEDFFLSVEDSFFWSQAYPGARIRVSIADLCRGYTLSVSKCSLFWGIGWVWEGVVKHLPVKGHPHIQSGARMVTMSVNSSGSDGGEKTDTISCYSCCIWWRGLFLWLRRHSLVRTTSLLESHGRTGVLLGGGWEQWSIVLSKLLQVLSKLP